MRCRRVGLSACPTKPWRSRACRRLRSSSKAKSYSYSHVSPGVATTLRLRLGVGMILGNLNWPQTERPNGMRPSNVLCCVWFAPPAQPCAARSFGRARSHVPWARTSERASVHPEWIPGRNRTPGHCRGRGLPGSRRRCLGDTGSIRRLRFRSRYPGTILPKRSQTVASGDPRIGLLPGAGDPARHPMAGGC